MLKYLYSNGDNKKTKCVLLLLSVRLFRSSSLWQYVGLYGRKVICLSSQGVDGYLKVLLFLVGTTT